MEIILRQAEAIENFTKKIEQLEQPAARQAAPSRMEDKDRVAQPQKPGRPKGHPG